MTNLEVAKQYVGNALAYGASCDLVTVMHNLEYIKVLLENPEAENLEHDWEDFK